MCQLYFVEQLFGDVIPYSSSLTVVWVTLAVVFGILEMILPSFSFVFASFAALITAIVALRFPWIVQLEAFSIFLIASLALVRPRFVKRLSSSPELPSRTQVLLGKMGKVTESIDPTSGTGRVLVGDEDWAAQSPRMITVGKTVIVEGADGIVLKVREI